MISMDSSPDIIKDASDALKPIEDRGITVMQGWYDKDLNKCHVTLWDLGETDDNYCCGCCCEALQAARRFAPMQPVATTN